MAVSSDHEVITDDKPPISDVPSDSERQLETPPAEEPAREITGFKWALVISAISSSIFLYALDNTVVADVQPVIITAFGEVDKLPWLSVAFLLGATATNMVWGKIYTQFNAKWFYVFSVFVFEVGSAVCGAAPSMNAIIIGRALCGVGGAGFKDARPGVAFKERAVEMDYVGTVLQAGALTMFVMAINWGGNIYPWKSGQVIGLFVGSGVLFIILGFQQTMTIFTTVSRRIIPVEFFKSRTIMILFAMTAASGSSAFVPIYFVPIFFQFTRGDGPLEAGVRLLPFIVVMVVMVFANGALMARWGYYMPWYLVGGLLAMAGSALMYTVDLETSSSRIYGYTVIIGVGVGMWLQASFSVAQAVVKPAAIGSAVGFMTLAQFLGITITLAIANAVFINSSQDRIVEILPNVPISEIQAAMQGSRTDFFQKLNEDQKTAVLEAIVKAIDKTYILVIVGGSLVATLSLFMKREKLFMASGVSAA
ncbi:MFS drug efflux transporter protein [Rutstroemia sp. NJR-2017a BBW]|nr:MFS drug efflux transporter protein [Rutstroemia sp. NJR-2017a BBW]